MIWRDDSLGKVAILLDLTIFHYLEDNASQTHPPWILMLPIMENYSPLRLITNRKPKNQ